MIRRTEKWKSGGKNTGRETRKGKSKKSLLKRKAEQGVELYKGEKD